MILQPKSNNLPETATTPTEAIVSAGLNMIPGSENAATVTVSAKSVAAAEDKKKDDAVQAATPRRDRKTPMKEEKPVLGQ